jgi:hypothetical protein
VPLLLLLLLLQGLHRCMGSCLQAVGGDCWECFDPDDAVDGEGAASKAAAMLRCSYALDLGNARFGSCLFGRGQEVVGGGVLWDSGRGGERGGEGVPLSSGTGGGQRGSALWLRRLDLANASSARQSDAMKKCLYACAL